MHSKASLFQRFYISTLLYITASINQRLDISTRIYSLRRFFMSTPWYFSVSICQRLGISSLLYVNDCISTLLYVNILVFQRFYAPTSQYIMSQWLYINASLCKRLVISTLQLDIAGITRLLHICQRLYINVSMLLLSMPRNIYASLCQRLSISTLLQYMSTPRYINISVCQRLGNILCTVDKCTVFPPRSWKLPFATPPCHY